MIYGNTVCKSGENDFVACTEKPFSEVVLWKNSFLNFDASQILFPFTTNEI